MRPRAILALVVAAIGLAAVGTAAAVLRGADDPAGRGASARAGDPGACRGLGGDLGTKCYTREFAAMVRGTRDPRPVVAEISDFVWAEGGWLLSSCHGIMHTVGRRYAAASGIELGTLMGFLPKSNDPACTAGFAHGMVTAVAPEIDANRPGEVARLCGQAGTRYQRYSCVHGFGHAFMRIYGDKLEPALHLCSALGSRAAPDCAQGAYHDYWFAVAGADDARLPEGEQPVKDPRRLCADQPAGFVRPCWYRAFLENRPAGFALETAADVDGLCSGLDGVQRSACVTGASVIGPPDPAAQLRLCANLSEVSDAASCVRGTKVQNLLGSSTSRYVRLIRGCDAFARRSPCYSWLGRTMAVLTDGAFARTGCPRLRSAPARRACAEGAARIDEALVTFS